MTANVREVAANHAAGMQFIGLLYPAMKLHEPAYRALVKADASADSFLHITNPSLWKAMRMGAGRANYEAQVKLAHAALAFIKVVDEVLPTLPPGEAGDAILG